MSDSEHDYDPAASASAEVEEPTTSVETSESSQPAATEPESTAFANDQDTKEGSYTEESDYNPEASAPGSPVQEEEKKTDPPESEKQEVDENKDDDDDDEDEDDYDPSAEVEDSSVSKPSNGSPPPAHNSALFGNESDNQLSNAERIQRFNSIIAHFMNNSGLLNDPTFQSLLPEQKSLVVLADYNKKHGTNYKTSINFGATTSFNRKQLKSNETAFPLVPLNPFCKRPDIEVPKSAEFQLDFNNFVHEETRWARNGKVEALPSGSRLFIGNLPVNAISKEDCYRIFRPYGDIVQISIKPGYGFVQFATAEACNAALEGESNVPLYGKMLQLEVSKTQIRQAQEYQEKKRRAGAGGNQGDSESNAYSRRGRSRSPSPRRDRGSKKRSPQQSRAQISDDRVSADCFIFQVNGASSLKVRNVVKIMRKHSISYKMEHDVSDVESAGNDAAYNGAIAVIVIDGDDIDVKTFEKTADGGIKFDEYTSVSVEEIDSILATSVSKRGAHNNTGYSAGGYDQKEHFRSSRGGRDNLNRNNNNSRRRGGRDRDNNHRGRGGSDGFRGNFGNNNNNNGNGNNQYGSAYPGYQQQQPAQVPPQMQQMPPVAQQMSPPIPNAAALAAQLQNYDPNTIQQVLAMLGNQQQAPSQQQPQIPMPQQYGGYQQSPPPIQQQPPYGGYGNTAPPFGGYPPHQQHAQQHAPPQVPPQQPYGGYAQPPPPAQHNQSASLPQAPQQQQQQQPPKPQAPPPGGDSLSALLARLKENKH